MKNLYHQRRKHHNRSLGIDKFFYTLLFIYIFIDSFISGFFNALAFHTIMSFLVLIFLRVVLLAVFIFIFIEHEKSKSMDLLIAEKKNNKHKDVSDISCLGCLYCDMFVTSNKTNRIYCSFYDSSELLSEDKSRCKCRELVFLNATQSYQDEEP